jgi:hypothetical protein
MTIEYAALGEYAGELAAFGLGVILIAAVLVWRKLRIVDARLGQICADLNQLQILESRRLIIAMNLKPDTDQSKGESNNTSIGLEGRAVAGEDRAPRSPSLDFGPSLAKRAELGELASLVPPVQIEDFFPGHEEARANRDMNSK